MINQTENSFKVSNSTPYLAWFEHWLPTIIVPLIIINLHLYAFFQQNEKGNKEMIQKKIQFNWNN